MIWDLLVGRGLRQSVTVALVAVVGKAKAASLKLDAGPVLMIEW
jgi:hypothetical protein